MVQKTETGIASDITLHPETTMSLAHVIVYAYTFIERLHALPAGVRMTARARHMVAALRTLGGYLAARTILHIVGLGPFHEESITAVVIRARESLVILYVTIWAYA